MSHILGMEWDSEFGCVSGSGSQEKIWVQTGYGTHVTQHHTVLLRKPNPWKAVHWGTILFSTDLI